MQQIFAGPTTAGTALWRDWLRCRGGLLIHGLLQINSVSVNGGRWRPFLFYRLRARCSAAHV